ncbi:RNA 2',3'-cyclic phosphodiesterase [Thiorhodococcus mannitoliphagus]|uniref:RNA 2',3'-cyclic phosphodiesterase n=1 Tax=Thiorhodococcus mannitoliphagus TaxID=329406 RepID=A0A6P1E1B7_9GAMM|nr:RNA 2',3'-cyclic phosphodiesterase [Thiorhodococcus mannitoliphagus]NEX21774.1 RNA 2',3'-cyclic phosphodiesterase [Thiorhodococcus mannitoliphagus]
MAEPWFLALWPGPQTRDALVRETRGALPPAARAVHPADLHLTLVFLGELDAARLSCAEAVAAAVFAPPFQLEIDRIGQFARARVLWCGPSRTPEVLAALVRGLQSGLERCGIPFDRRPYRPHLTLARKVSNHEGHALSGTVAWSVRELVLAYGVPGSKPRYRIHRRWPLSTSSGPPVLS